MKAFKMDSTRNLILALANKAILRADNFIQYQLSSKNGARSPQSEASDYTILSQIQSMTHHLTLNKVSVDFYFPVAGSFADCI